MNDDDIELTDSQSLARKWLSAIKERGEAKAEKNWVTRSKKIIKRYRDEREASDDSSKFNILWSNVETIMPATYARTPKADVSRRNTDENPVARTAARILERALQYEINEYPDFDDTMRLCVMDRLLPGRGTAWVRFETYDVSRPEDQTLFPQNEAEVASFAAEQTPAQPGVLERAVVDYVYWEDFRHSDGRTWADVTWVARRVYMGKRAGIERFGEGFANVPMLRQASGIDDGDKSSAGKKATVWEVWDKDTRLVYWVAEGYSELLDVKQDIYGLEGFFPCPKPLYATQTSDQLTPIPDFSLYQDQAAELDLITTRINGLVKAMRLNGAYDASQPELSRILSSNDNTLIPVENWGALSEKGGIGGAISWVPIRDAAQALVQLYASRDQTKQVIYEITGLSDIIRGATKASETATAQNIKRQFGSLRLETRQHQIAVFATELLKIKAEMMMDLYSPQTLIAMSGMIDTLDAPYIEPAIMLMKSEPVRAYKIEVAADSLVALDEEQQKDDAVEFLGAAGVFIRQTVEAVQVVPEIGPLAMELLLMGVRSFKAGRQVEAAFEQFKAQIEQSRGQQGQEQAQEDDGRQELQKAQMEAQADLMRERIKGEVAVQVERERAQINAQLEAMRAQHDAMKEQWKAQLDAAVKVQLESMRSAKDGVIQISPATVASERRVAREIQ